MTVELLPPVSSSMLGYGPRPVALKVGPRFARSRNMSRWHRVRSGRRYPTHTSLSFWCGQASNSAPLLERDDDPIDGVPVCGACEGRAIGAGQEDNDGPRDLTFTPRWITPPSWCPGSQDELYEPTPDPRGWPRVGTCLACGAVEPVRAKGGPYRSSVGLARHRPLALVAGCPFHAWQYLTRLDDGDVGCRCGEPLGSP